MRQLGVVVTGFLIVSGGEAPIHGKIGENLVGPLPVNAVGGDPSHYPALENQS